MKKQLFKPGDHLVLKHSVKVSNWLDLRVDPALAQHADAINSIKNVCLTKRKNNSNKTLPKGTSCLFRGYEHIPFISYTTIRCFEKELDKLCSAKKRNTAIAGLYGRYTYGTESEIQLTFYIDRIFSKVPVLIIDNELYAFDSDKVFESAETYLSRSNYAINIMGQINFKNLSQDELQKNIKILKNTFSSFDILNITYSEQ